MDGRSHLEKLRKDDIEGNTVGEHIYEYSDANTTVTNNDVGHYLEVVSDTEVALESNTGTCATWVG